MQVTPTVRLVRELGAGGMGRVWVAEHSALGTEVVVKFLSTDLMDDPNHVARFQREATATAQVKSPHVVQIFDHGVTPDNQPWIVMELLEGEDLAAVLLRRGKLQLDEVVDNVRQITLALGRAHARGIVHRDIKPSNVFICDRGDGAAFVKLLDFGIAKGPLVDGVVTATGAIVGTPAYASPEQITGQKDITLQSDVWSIGVLAYHAMTGKMPWSAVSVAQLAIAIHSKSARPPTSVAPELPAAIDNWFAKACALDKKERFGSAQESADALAFAAGGSMQGRARGPNPSDAPPRPDPDDLAHAVTATLVDPNPPVRSGPPPAMPDPTTTSPSSRDVAKDAGESAPLPAPRSRAPLVIAIAGIAAVLLVAATVIVTRAPAATPAGPSTADAASDSSAR